MSFTKLAYCQYLLSSQVNYALMNLAEHLKRFSHDTIKCCLKGSKAFSSPLLWGQVQPLLELDPGAYLIFDDTVLGKSFGLKLEVVNKQLERQREGTDPRHRGVSCVYANPKTEHFWVVDYRIFDPDANGLGKLDYAGEMLRSADARHLAFGTVLVDSWYATKDRMLLIDGM